ncbi:hypothetical protein R5H32_07930 [Defluviimonas sp. D31]|uniref:HupE/UreJ family protein n=1 Tax=Defluviimonas sp. D31 TaxID=3083253 RepID=UPI00296F9E1B|nr:HupE/UreJ family protein [Defluviimonas sp. D31]MDW4549276.1 hypothetical protein [Defluviimonas sp. D31]
MPWPRSFSITLLLADAAFAYSVTPGDKRYIHEITRAKIIPFLCLGAKQMVTVHDHIVSLFGVIFFLDGMKQIGLYVSLFAFGQLIALGVIPIVMTRWRATPSFARQAYARNAVMMGTGFLLMG